MHKCSYNAPLHFACCVDTKYNYQKWKNNKAEVYKLVLEWLCLTYFNFIPWYAAFADYCSFYSSVTVGGFSQCTFSTLPTLDQRHFIPVSFILCHSQVRRFYCILAIEMLFQNLVLHAQISDFHCPLASQ